MYSLMGISSTSRSPRPMMTFSSMLMAKTLIWGITFIKIPIPTWPISSAARIGIQSLTPRMVQSKKIWIIPA